MERFPLKSSVPKMGTTYQSVYKKDEGQYRFQNANDLKAALHRIGLAFKKGTSTTNGRGGHSTEDDMVDIAPGPPRAADTTPTSHGTFQLYEHSGRNSNASANSYIAQYFNSAAGKGHKESVSGSHFLSIN